MRLQIELARTTPSIANSVPVMVTWGRTTLLKVAGNMLRKRSYLPLTEPI